MDIKDFYQEIQGDFEEACKRMLKEEMVTRFVKKFPSDTCVRDLCAAVEDGDIDASFRAVHTLKGVTGNLAFTKLYNAVWKLTEQLRTKLEPADPELLENLLAEYDKTIAAIEKLS